MSLQQRVDAPVDIPTPSAHGRAPLKIVAVVATLPSRALELARALRSILSQQRRPDEVVVVVDYPKPLPAGDGNDADVPKLAAEAYAEVLRTGIVRELFGRALAPSVNTSVTVLVNGRTKNVSGTGCWNTGIQAAVCKELRTYTSENCNTFVAILDDDDEWKPDHLSCCAELVGTDHVHWVVSGIERREFGDTFGTPTYESATRGTMTVQSFLASNPGVQGSNVFMRLSLLLRAGGFDESLQSMTDRDLCIRALDVLGPTAVADGSAVKFTEEHTVVHHAESDRARVTTDKLAKRRGLLTFLWKHGHRFSQSDYDSMCDRSQAKFGIDVDKLLQSNTASAGPSNNLPLRTMSGELMRLRPASQQYLQENAGRLCLRKSARSPPLPDQWVLRGLIGICTSDPVRLGPLLRDIARLPEYIDASVVVFVNTTDEKVNAECQFLLEGTGLQCESIKFDSTFARNTFAKYVTTLQHTAPAACQRQRYEIGIARTILQTYMKRRLDAAPRPFDFAMVLDDDKRLPASSFLNAKYMLTLDRSCIYVGRDCKTAPNTVAFGLRVQLLDLCFSLSRRNSAPEGLLATLSVATRFEQDHFDAYYDLSTSRFDHLEAPQLTHDFEDLNARIWRGDPLARDCLPPLDAEETGQRGGCLLVFRQNFDCLACPQFTPMLHHADGYVLSRRSDSLWLSVQRDRGIVCRVCPGLFVFHVNEHDAIPSPMSVRQNALAETIGSILCRSDPGDRERYLRHRLCALVSNNERIRGLLTVLGKLPVPESLKLNATLQRIESTFDEEAWRRDVVQPVFANYKRLKDWRPGPHVEKWESTSLPLPSFLRNVEARVAVPPLVSACKLPVGVTAPPTTSGTQTTEVTHMLHTFERNSVTGAQCRVLVGGDVSGQGNVPVRIHSQCFSGDVLRSLRCDCGEQLSRFQTIMRDSKCSVLVYIDGHEGRGNGWDNKSLEYALNDRNPDANHNDLLCSLPGCRSDKREYDDASRILRHHLGIRSVVLYTNNRNKRDSLTRVFGADCVSLRPLPASIQRHNEKYLREKVKHLGHGSELVDGLPVVVTGVAGFIGSALARRLLDEGKVVIGIDNFRNINCTDRKQQRVINLQCSKFTFHDSIDEVNWSDLGPIVVYHLAGQPGVRYCEEHSEACARCNDQLTSRLLSMLVHEGTHVVFSSSSTVYGSARATWDEDCDLKPTCVYARSKVACEALLRDFAVNGMRATVLRLFSVIGEDCREDLAPSIFMRNIAADAPIYINGDGSAQRDFTYIGDVVDGMIRAASRTTQQEHPFRIYNLGRGKPRSIAKLIDILEEELSTKAVKEYKEAIVFETPRTCADNTRAKTELGFEPNIGLRVAVQRMLSEFRTRPIRFYGSKCLYFQFSNFAPYEIELNGHTWPTSEHYYQAQKFNAYPQIQQEIRKLSTPEEAFAASRSRAHRTLVRKEWSKVKDGVMLAAVQAKFQQHPSLRALLLRTGTQVLVEHTSKDRYWGDGGDGTGRNQMGTTLMAVRANLRKDMDGGEQSRVGEL